MKTHSSPFLKTKQNFESRKEARNWPKATWSQASFSARKSGNFCFHARKISQMKYVKIDTLLEFSS